MTETALVVRGVRRTYDARTAPVRALRGVDLVLRQGEFVALMGPSGCGKSTLLHVIAGLEPADEGSVEIAGTRVDDLGAAALARFRRRHIGLVFQFFHLVEHLTALENIVLAALIGGARPAAAGARAHELLDRLGLLDKAGDLPATLSGGQRQRVAIARALANRPGLLLADEPTGALDSAGTAEVLDLFRRMHEAGQTILVVTHSAEVAARAERVVHLRDGRVGDPGPAGVAAHVPASPPADERHDPGPATITAHLPAAPGADEHHDPGPTTITTHLPAARPADEHHDPGPAIITTHLPAAPPADEHSA